jgi:hypothetical protein
MVKLLRRQEAEYSFIFDNIFLVANVSEYENNKYRQYLIFRKRNKNNNKIEFEKKLSCIHTVVMTIKSTEDLEEVSRKSLAVRLSENLSEINLSYEEKFKAFNSWVAGIANYGLDSIRIQSEIEEYYNLMYTIGKFLLRCLSEIDSGFHYQYIDKTIAECRYEGLSHLSSLFLNLNQIEFKDSKVLDYLLDNVTDKFIDFVINHGFNGNHILKAIALQSDLLKVKKKSNDFNRLLSNNFHLLIHQYLVVNPSFINLKEFLTFFKHPRREIRLLIAINPNSIQFKEFDLFFNDRSKYIRFGLIYNPSIFKLEKQLDKLLRSSIIIDLLKRLKKQLKKAKTFYSTGRHYSFEWSFKGTITFPYVIFHETVIPKLKDDHIIKILKRANLWE